MVAQCKEFCSEHSGCVNQISQLEKRADEIKLELEKYKSYSEGKMDKFSSDMRELSKEFTKKLDDSVSEIKAIIDAKENSRDGKKWILIGSLCSPALIIIFQKLAEHFIK